MIDFEMEGFSATQRYFTISLRSSSVCGDPNELTKKKRRNKERCDAKGKLRNSN